MHDEYPFNADSAKQKELVIRDIQSLRGPHVITIRRAGRRISNGQRALYFAAYVRAYQKYFRDQGQPFSLALCHYLLKRRFLKMDIFDKNSGELIGEKVGSIADGGNVDGKEMGEFLDNVHQFLVGELQLSIPDVRREILQMGQPAAGVNRG